MTVDAGESFIARRKRNDREQEVKRLQLALMKKTTDENGRALKTPAIDRQWRALNMASAAGLGGDAAEQLLAASADPAADLAQLATELVQQQEALG